MVAPAFARAAERLRCAAAAAGCPAARPAHRGAAAFGPRPSGGPIAARRVVNCAGAEAAAVAAMVGLELPLRGLPDPGQRHRARGTFGPPPGLLGGRRLTLKQARSGGAPDRRRLSGAARPGTGRPLVDPDPVRANLAPRSEPSRRWAKRSSCAPGPRSSTAPRTGARSWARCRGVPASGSACSPGSASAPARSPRSRGGGDPGPRARGRHLGFRALTAGNHAELRSVPGLHG